MKTTSVYNRKKNIDFFQWVYILMFFLSSQFEDGLGIAACNF